MNDKVKKVNSIAVQLDRNLKTGKFLIVCSARYIINGDPGNSGIIYNVYEVPDKLPIEDAAKYSEQLFREGLIKKGYVIEDGEGSEQ